MKVVVYDSFCLVGSIVWIEVWFNLGRFVLFGYCDFGWVWWEGWVGFYVV